MVFRLKQAAPEFVETISANTDLPIESKARWDAGGKELYGQKVVGTGPFEFVERKVSAYVLYKRVENHWRKTPEIRELEFRWVPEDVTRLATLLSGEVHISDVPRTLQKEHVVGIEVRPDPAACGGVAHHDVVQPRVRQEAKAPQQRVRLGQLEIQPVHQERPP